MVSGRVVNVLVQHQLDVISKQLREQGENSRMTNPPNFLTEDKGAWVNLFTYVFLLSLQSHGGLIESCRKILWLSIRQVFVISLSLLNLLQYSTRTLLMRALKHVHSLSLDYHLNQKPGEVASTIRKATAVRWLLRTLIGFWLWK